MHIICINVIWKCFAFIVNFDKANFFYDNGSGNYFVNSSAMILSDFRRIYSETELWYLHQNKTLFLKNSSMSLCIYEIIMINRILPVLVSMIILFWKMIICNNIDIRKRTCFFEFSLAHFTINFIPHLKFQLYTKIFWQSQKEFILNFDDGDMTLVFSVNFIWSNEFV